MVSSPHSIACIDSSFNNDWLMGLSRGTMGSEGQGFRVPKSYVKAIACEGRHNAVITDAGALLTFGWGLYGQELAHLRFWLCRRYLKERQFWRIYFTLVSSYVAE